MSLFQIQNLNIYNSGHVPMEENPQETLDDVLEFLKR